MGEEEEEVESCYSVKGEEVKWLNLVKVVVVEKLSSEMEEEVVYYYLGLEVVARFGVFKLLEERED